MEYKCKDGMIDNRMVKDDHQQGIKRVLQRGHNPLDYEGHGGSMKDGWKHGHGEKKTHWKQGGQLVPRKA